MDRHDNRIQQHLRTNAIYSYRKVVNIGKKRIFHNIKYKKINIREMLKRNQLREKR